MGELLVNGYRTSVWGDGKVWDTVERIIDNSVQLIIACH